MGEIGNAAEKIIDCCIKENIEKAYCCITRLRLRFKNKELVNFDALEAMDLVKGIFWYGDECQLVIGLEAMAINETMQYLLSV